MKTGTFILALLAASALGAETPKQVDLFPLKSGSLKITFISVALLPMNQPDTMTPEQAAAAARSFRPKILYPYHYGDTDPQKLVAALKNSPGIEVRIRDLR